MFRHHKKHLTASLNFFFNKLLLLLFSIQQVLISHPFYTHQCIHVHPNLPIHPTTTTTPRCFPPLVSIHFFSTSVSQFLPCKPVHLYHFLGSTYIASLNLYLVFPWQDAAAAIDNMVWLGILLLTEVAFCWYRGHLFIHEFAEPPKLQGCMGKYRLSSCENIHCELIAFDQFDNIVNANHPCWPVSHWLPVSRIGNCKHNANWLHNEVAYFTKEAGFHEVLDPLTIKKRNSTRIKIGYATDANDWNSLENSLGKTM